MARWDEAQVTERKILDYLDYLLAADHPVGGDKAAFFAAIGYTRADWMDSAARRSGAPRTIRFGEIVTETRTPFGIKYVVDGLIRFTPRSVERST